MTSPAPTSRSVFARFQRLIPDPGDYLTAQECADLLGIRRDTWMSYSNRGNGPKPDVNTPETGVLWLRSTFDRYVSGRRGKGHTHPDITSGARPAPAQVKADA